MGVESALRQMESKREALGVVPAAATASPRPEGVLSSAGDQLEPVSGPQPDVPAAQVRSQSAPPVILGAAARPTITDAYAAVGRTEDGQPQGSRAPVPLAADVAWPVAFPWVCLILPSVHMHPYGPVLGFAPGPPPAPPRGRAAASVPPLGAWRASWTCHLPDCDSPSPKPLPLLSGLPLFPRVPATSPWAPRIAWLGTPQQLGAVMLPENRQVDKTLPKGSPFLRNPSARGLRDVSFLAAG